MQQNQEDIKAVRRAVTHLAWPVMLQHLLMSLMFLSDTIMLGWYSQSALAAVGLSGPITMMIRLTMLCIPIAATAMVARSIGEQNGLKTKTNAVTALTIGIILGGIISLFGAALAGNIVAIFTPASSILHKEAVTYLAITLSAFVMNYLFFISTAILRGAGDTRTSLMVTIFANILNIIGDYIMIYGKLGFPEMGVKGAAISTFGSSVIEGLILFSFLFSKKSAVKLSIKDFWLVNKATLKTMVKIALPAAFEPMITSMGGLVVLKIVAGLGQASLATHHIILRIESLSFMPGMGLSMATAALVGQYLGAKRTDLANLTCRQSIRFALVIMGLLGLAFLLFPSQIISVFTGDTDVRTLGIFCLMIAAIEQPFLGYAMIHQGTFRGAGDTTTPLYINFIGVWLIRLPLAFLFVSILHWGLAGAWLTMPIDWLIRSVIYNIIYKTGRWKKISL
ncbi:MAG: MATE family efflux transporter [Planctomycetes bacterium]|nr:MATE family efflux transporter [Planctomycetota bacterium]